MFVSFYEAKMVNHGMQRSLSYEQQGQVCSNHQPQ